MHHRLLRIVAVVGGAGLLLGACSGGDDSSSASASFSTGSSAGSSAGGARTVEITLTDAGCEPNTLSAPAGPTTFHVTNDGAAGVTEFEVLKGGKIVGEVENVAPGLDRSFSLTLQPGSYTTKCTGGSKEDGTLEVT